jgi:succinate dehydrogenase/fumarate reductase flavoprotein subunit
MTQPVARNVDPLEAGSWDLIVVGAGCAGMATALFAAIEGLSVLVLERSRWVGGTSALAAGAVWIPNTHLATGSGDTREKAERYLAEACKGGSPTLRTRFLDLGPTALRCLEAHTDVHMRTFSHHPDYLSELEGASTSGRVLECLPFDGRRLGDALSLVRPPIPEFTVLGGMMVDRIDIGHLMNMKRSRASFVHASRLLLHYGLDRLCRRRGSRMVMGNALIGRLLLSLRKRGVPIRTGMCAERLLTEDGRVTGIQVRGPEQSTPLRARLGVVLAGGGFNDHPLLRPQLIPPEAKFSPRALSSPGLLLHQALSLGARLEPAADSAAFWAPVSVRQRADGSRAVFPHFVLDRAKPGTLVVNTRAQRFLNESCSYHLFGERMLKATAGGERPDAVAYLIADRRALLRYGLGMVRPGGRGVDAFVREGYLTQQSSLAELAGSLGIDAAALQLTVDRMNGFAGSGIDEDFQRGSTAYQRNLGDPAVQPNPTLGPIEQAPFYAVTLYPGDIGSIVGLATDVDARVLRDDEPIAGLFAVGNDMQSIMGGAYPGPGINLGPAIVFACAAAQAAVRAARERTAQGVTA